MDATTAHKVTDLTTQFYAAVADSFSETRSSAWTGWQRVLDLADAEGEQPFKVLDIACGNMRFERFLAESGANVQRVRAIDNCMPLVEDGAQRNCEDGERGFPFPVHIQEADIVQALGPDAAAPDAPEHLFGAADHNLSVCFGFMHHLPHPEQRRELLRHVVHATEPGGIIAVSFWQFANSERLLRKAHEATERAAAIHNIAFEDGNDYLLGWKDEHNVFRYCHNYTEDEIDALIDAVACESAASAPDVPRVRQIARFSSDGAEGNLNRYVVLKVEGL